MSTEENKEVERRIIEEIFDKRDLAVADELIASNWVYRGLGGMEFVGHEGLKQMLTLLDTAFPDFHMTVDDIVAEGDKVVCLFTFQGTHQGEFLGIPPTGKQVTNHAVAIARFAGGKQAEVLTITNELRMMQQMGVGPAMG